MGSNGLVDRPVNVVVSRLCAHYDCWIALQIDPVTIDAVLRIPVKPNFKPVRDRTQKWHIGRIRYFVERLAIGESLDPIDIEQEVTSCGWSVIWHGPSVEDGHHRLLAALLHGSLTVRANVGGTVKFINWLCGTGRANNPPWEQWE